MSRLQIAIIFISIIAAGVAVAIFAGALPGMPSMRVREKTEVIFWGTLNREQIDFLLQEFSQKNFAFKASYREIKSEAYEKELVEALAEGKGPDVFILTQDLILKHKNKIFPVPYEAYSARQFKDLFFDGAEIFGLKEGVIGFPVFSDPMVIYWNRGLFRNAGLTAPPKTWDEFLSMSARLTAIDAEGNIIQSGAALGEFQNVSHAKDILALLILQTGNPIVSPVDLRTTLDEFQENIPLKGVETALRFFGEFKKTGSSAYSWNLNMPESKEAFIEGRLAMYLGYGSEYPEIKNKNPHLDFDIAVVPQIRGSKDKIAFARIGALSISKSSQARKAAFALIQDLLNEANQEKISRQNFLASPLRSLLAKDTKDPVFDVLNNSAIISKAWLDPEPEETRAIFKIMAEDYISGRKDLDKAVSSAKIKLEGLLAKYKSPESMR